MKENMLQEKRLFFLGAGAMGEALVKGLVAADVVPAEHITISNRKRPERLDRLQRLYGVAVCRDGEKAQAIANADLLVLAVKPRDLPQALQEIAPVVTERHLVISLVAGTSIATLEQRLGRAVPLMRVMPNIASQVRASATALAGGTWATEQHLAMVEHIFSTIGTVICVEEHLMNTITGLSGSGPAYFCYVIEALMSAGQASGLSDETCRDLLIQTMDGVVQMLRKTGMSPAQLRQQVTSPNGTTMAAIATLERANVQHHFMDALQSAARRAGELDSQYSCLTDYNVL